MCTIFILFVCLVAFAFERRKKNKEKNKKPELDICGRLTILICIFSYLFWFVEKILIFSLFYFVFNLFMCVFVMVNLFLFFIFQKQPAHIKSSPLAGNFNIVFFAFVFVFFLIERNCLTADNFQIFDFYASYMQSVQSFKHERVILEKGRKQQEKKKNKL